MARTLPIIHHPQPTGAAHCPHLPQQSVPSLSFRCHLPFPSVILSLHIFPFHPQHPPEARSLTSLPTPPTFLHNHPLLSHYQHAAFPNPADSPLSLPLLLLSPSHCKYEWKTNSILTSPPKSFIDNCPPTTDVLWSCCILTRSNDRLFYLIHVLWIVIVKWDWEKREG